MNTLEIGFFYLFNIGVMILGLFVLYLIIKKAVKKGILEAFDEMKKNE